MSKPKAPESQDDIDAQFLLNRPEFRRWFLRIMESAGMGYDTFRADPYAHAYQAGQVGLGNMALQTLLNVDPQARLVLEIERSRITPQETESND